MGLFGVESWALWCAFVLMALAAAINARTYMVPNRLSLSAAILGWLAALLVSGLESVPSLGGGILASLVGSGVGFGLLLPFFLAGYLGAGCVKMQAAFGAWVGSRVARFAGCSVGWARDPGGRGTQCSGSVYQDQQSATRGSG